jgi:amidase
VSLSEHVGIGPGPLRIAMSTRFPFTGFRAKLHPEIRAACQTVGHHLENLGHTIMEGNPDYGLRLSWNFLSRSTSGLLDWADRVGDGVTLDGRTLANMRMGRLLSAQVAKAREQEAQLQRRIGAIFNTVDVILAPTTAQPPPLARAFDGLGGMSTDRAMIAACPVTWPWNVLGWPSINVPAGFTSDGLPIGVQLMGPANSEPLLVSLAAELEAVSGWTARQPQVWWNTPLAKDLSD